MKQKQPWTQKGQDIIDLNEDDAREYLERILWPDGPVCVHCQSKNVAKLKGESSRAGLHQCRDCRGQFTVTMKTIFEDSHIPLSKWVKGFHLMCSSKKGISALQLQRNLGLGSYRTAWFMAHRIRLAMTDGLQANLKGTVEVDETYVGGKVRGQGCKAGWDNKTPVVSLVERGGSKRSVVVAKVTAKNLRAAVMDHVEPGTHIHTDEHKGYKNLKDGFKHGSVNTALASMCAASGTARTSPRTALKAHSRCSNAGSLVPSIMSVLSISTAIVQSLTSAGIIGRRRTWNAHAQRCMSQQASDWFTRL